MSKAIEVRTYQSSKAALFRKTSEKYGGLSNMAPGYALRVNDSFVRTSEALYQVCRYPHLPQVQMLILQQSSPMTAKMYARKYLSKTRPDWDDVRVPLMRWCLRAKLLQNKKVFGELLLATGSLPIVEYSKRDDFWGAKLQPDGITLVGRNVLGRLLMELRELYREGNFDSNRLKPINIPNFKLFGDPIKPLVGYDTSAFADVSASERMQINLI